MQSWLIHILVRYRPSDRQLARMLIIQVLTHILLNLLFCVISFMPIIIRCRLNLPFCFIFSLLSQLYRTEFILLLRKISPIHRNRIIHPMRTQPGTIPINTAPKSNY
jgi:hypothetical protein